MHPPAPVISVAVRDVLGDVNSFLTTAEDTGRGVVLYQPAAPTRELALLAGARIASRYRLPLRVVLEPHLHRPVDRVARAARITVDHWATPVAFAVARDLDEAVLVVLCERPRETSGTGQLITAAITRADLVVVREAAGGNPDQLAAVTSRPHATHATRVARDELAYQRAPVVMDAPVERLLTGAIPIVKLRSSPAPVHAPV